MIKSMTNQVVCRLVYNPHDDLSNLIRLQNQSCKLISGKSYQVFLGNDVQLQDVELFCCDNNGVILVDTTFNLCDS